jgi:hypothetical protein
VCSAFESRDVLPSANASAAAADSHGHAHEHGAHCTDAHCKHDHSSGSSSASGAADQKGGGTGGGTRVRIDHGITTLTLEPDTRRGALALDPDRLKAWLAALLWTDQYDEPIAALPTSTATAAGEAKAGGGAVPMDIAKPTNATAAVSSASAGGAAATVTGGASSSAPCVYRMKGVLHMRGEARPHFLQAVQAVYDIAPADDPAGDPSRAHQSAAAAGAVRGDPYANWQPVTRIVVIGRNLDARAAASGLAACLVPNSASAAAPKSPAATK